MINQSYRMKMNTNSNGYTIGYASVMVIIVAFLLAFVASSLKERQDNNVKLDKMKQILSSLNIPAEELKDAENAYNLYVKADQILDLNGNVVNENGGFDIESKKIDDQLPLYVCAVNGETKYVAPLYDYLKSQKRGVCCSKRIKWNFIRKR